MPAVSLFLLADTPTITDAALAALPWSASSLRRLEQIAHAARRRQFMLGRCLLAHAAARFLAEPLTVEAIEEREQASPVVASQPQLAVSLSHSGAWLGVALAQDIASISALGLDLELARPRNVLALARHAYAAADLAWVEQGSGAIQADRFYRVWTLREAAFKARLREHVYGEPAALLLLDDPCAATGLIEPALYWAVVAAQPVRVDMHCVVLSP